MVSDDENAVVMGDFNGTVGKRKASWNPHLGPYSDVNTECNYSGQHMLSL